MPNDLEALWSVGQPGTHSPWPTSVLILPLTLPFLPFTITSLPPESGRLHTPLLLRKALQMGTLPSEWTNLGRGAQRSSMCVTFFTAVRIAPGPQTLIAPGE